VLNQSAASKRIPARTRNRILNAARDLNYRPNFFARTLRHKRTYTVGVIAREIGEAFGSTVISGAERFLRSQNYFFLTVIHRHDPELIESYTRMLEERGVEGLLAVDTALTRPLRIPTVSVGGHRNLDGITNVVLDHNRAAQLALRHLLDLGHRKIGFLRGQKLSSDSRERWESIQSTCKQLGLEILPEQVVEMDRDDASPETGYDFTKTLLSMCPDFTAIFAHNDITAIGAVRALSESGLRVPDDISVLGFDDIRVAGFCNPSLTTVRQPLNKMGEIAAQALVDRIEKRIESLPEIKIEPLLVIRESTGRCRPRR
jgi:DNA-binding LacI/PurR family transcriptional regulator